MPRGHHAPNALATQMPPARRLLTLLTVLMTGVGTITVTAVDTDMVMGMLLLLLHANK